MPEGLASKISEELKNYTDDVSEGIEKEAQATANNIRDELRQTSPERTGDYAKGWTRRKTGRGDTVSHTVYNKDKWQLTHLLENGHLARNGSRVPAQKHIEPIETKYNASFEKRVAEIIEKGGK